MPAAELAEWMAFAELEPFGETRADLRSGIVAATVANSVRDPEQRRQPFGPADFVPGPFGPEAADEQRANEAALSEWHAHRAARAIHKIGER